MPGFRDTRGIPWDITAGVSAQMLKDNFKTLRALVLICTQSDLYDARIEGVRDSLEMVGKIIQENPVLLDNLVLIVSKAPEDLLSEQGPSVIKNRLQKILNENRDNFPASTSFILEHIKVNQIYIADYSSVDFRNKFLEHVKKNMPQPFMDFNFDCYHREAEKFKSLLLRLNNYQLQLKKDVQALKAFVGKQQKEALAEQLKRVSAMPFPIEIQSTFIPPEFLQQKRILENTLIAQNKLKVDFVKAVNAFDAYLNQYFPNTTLPVLISDNDIVDELLQKQAGIAVTTEFFHNIQRIVEQLELGELNIDWLPGLENFHNKSSINHPTALYGEEPELDNDLERCSIENKQGKYYKNSKANSINAGAPLGTMTSTAQNNEVNSSPIASSATLIKPWGFIQTMASALTSGYQYIQATLTGASNPALSLSSENRQDSRSETYNPEKDATITTKSFNGSNWLNDTVKGLFGVPDTTLQEHAAAINSQPGLNSTAEQYTLQHVNQPLAFSEKLIFAQYVFHYIKKYSPLTLPWNQQRSLTMNERKQLLRYQGLIKSIHITLLEQATSRASQFLEANERLAYCNSALSSLTDILTEALANNKITGAQFSELENKLQRIEDNIHKIANYNKKLRKQAAKHDRREPSMGSALLAAQALAVPQIPGLRYEKVRGDGDCLFSAIGLYLNKSPQVLRLETAQYLEEHLERFVDHIADEYDDDDFTIEGYIKSIRNGEKWGDHIEIIVLAEKYQRPIVVIESGGGVYNPSDLTEANVPQGKPIFIYYNGVDHYDALRLTGEREGKTILEELLSLSPGMTAIAQLSVTSEPAPIQSNTNIILPRRELIDSCRGYRNFERHAFWQHASISATQSEQNPLVSSKPPQLSKS
jgi:hypothetical protein